MESIETEDISTDRSLEGLEQTYKYPVNYSKRGVVLLKEYVNTSALSKHDLKHNVVGSEKTACTYCGESVDTDVILTIEDLNTSCHPSCFKCGICSKPMGDLLGNMFLRQGTVHCGNCYAKVN
ncbi:hypothetical protein AALO_G00265140 [Alosa alosa]|uniref:LIM zinc-binding domain-containing protein n=1 Tax=Alosa alosa TaxID=278164 RepID=A0AAV6FPN3_9TELE|nr:zinc finger protein 185-like [Alosa sapidissima]XP_048088005.1 zinc finger protein 185-like isoform X2 [Alosa alosa]KAG5263466.1 hypothetical protein AALO_G00265140 [Alosa alosa]